MKATKADIIVTIAKEIQDLHDEFYAHDITDFANALEFYTEQDRIEDLVYYLYKDIGKVLKNQDIDN